MTDAVFPFVDSSPATEPAVASPAGEKVTIDVSALRAEMQTLNEGSPRYVELHHQIQDAYKKAYPPDRAAEHDPTAPRPPLSPPRDARGQYAAMPLESVPALRAEPRTRFAPRTLSRSAKIRS